MRIRLSSRKFLLLVAFVAIALCTVDVSAQQRRRRRPSRRVTNPITSQAPATTTTTTTQPVSSSSSTDPTIISTANDTDAVMTGTAPATSSRSRSRSRAGGDVATESEQEALRRTVDKLSSQVTQLSDKIGMMERQQRTLVDMERLSRAETRAENFRTQLRDVQAKEADLQARADQIEFDLRPENIERASQTFGSTRPEEVRDARRRQLENERTRVQSQLQLLAQSRARLETAIADADAEADAIRKRMEEDGTAPKTDGNSTNTEATPATTTTTTPPDQSQSSPGDNP